MRAETSRGGMMVLALCEFVTALQCLLLSLSMAWDTLTQILLGANFALAMLAAVWIGYGALRRSPFVPKAAVILAAFLGLPNLTTVANLVGAFLAYGPGTITNSYGLMALLGISQLIPFFLGIRSLTEK